jgi:phage terminase large subunit-like protein
VVVVATDERQAGVVFGAAARPATTELYEAVVNGAVSHSGDPRLTRHVANATIRTDNRGTPRIYKEHKHSTRPIDLAVCAIMAHSVACDPRSRAPALLVRRGVMILRRSGDCRRPCRPAARGRGLSQRR